MNIRRWMAACMMLVSGVSVVSADSSMTLATWVVYWDQAKVVPALQQYGADFQELHLFSYEFSPQGQLMPGDFTLSNLAPMAKSLVQPHQGRVLITVVNDVRGPGGNKLKDGDMVHQVIATPEARQAHIQQILSLVGDLDGVDVDYEKVHYEDAAAFQQFIAALAGELHKRNKWLAVVVQPRTEEKFTPGLQKSGNVTMDWQALASIVDEVIVMAYLNHFPGGPSGPLAPTSWVRQIAAYGLSKMPKEKLCIALHTGGFDWTTGKPTKAAEYVSAQMAAQAHGAALAHQPGDTACAHASYRDSDGAHDVWVEDAAGIQEKIRALRSDGVQHIALWRLGSGDPAIWSSLRSEK